MQKDISHTLTFLSSFMNNKTEPSISPVMMHAQLLCTLIHGHTLDYGCHLNFK